MCASNFNIEKQIGYWKNGALSDIETAEILIEKGKYLNGLFFCHLTIEKALKAYYVKFNLILAPRTHNLLFLADKTDLELNDSQLEFLAILLNYQMEGRYPEDQISIPSKECSYNYLNETKELLSWLIQKL